MIIFSNNSTKIYDNYCNRNDENLEKQNDYVKLKNNIDSWLFGRITRGFVKIV